MQEEVEREMVTNVVGVEKYAKNLEGISYLEWIKLKIAIDELFNSKRRELEKDIQLSNANEITDAIHRQFG